MEETGVLALADIASPPIEVDADRPVQLTTVCHLARRFQDILTETGVKPCTRRLEALIQKALACSAWVLIAASVAIDAVPFVIIGTL